MDYKLIIAPKYIPKNIPDTAKIEECLNNIAEVATGLDYCRFSYIFENLNDIRAACGLEENTVIQVSEKDLASSNGFHLGTPGLGKQIRMSKIKGDINSNG